MDKLTALIKAAKAATPGPWETDWKDHDSPHQNIQIRVGRRNIASVWIDDACFDENGQQKSNADFIALANPATILELCDLLEKAEEALKCVKVYIPPSFANTHNECHEALAAIKQWKEVDEV